MANTGHLSHLEVGDFLIPLTARGRKQARQAGTRVGPAFIDDCLIFCSPYRRAQQTLEEILRGGGVQEDYLQQGAGAQDDVDDLDSSNDEEDGSSSEEDEERAGDNPPRPYRIREDPRLREVDHGYEDLQAQEAKRERHGWFYYRFNGGESPADCYDRTSIFMESLIRQVERKAERENKPVKVLIVSHGLTIRCFVMRYLHLKVADFDTIANPHNCDVITLGLKDDLTKEFGKDSWLFSTGRWAVHGLKKRDD
ncbi:phosphoglycerate mutase family domain containing protein [Acanthamoeba castellanii str. Neff]|uniref:Phosphoglycerate mutase family domain containing protein n=1 Tax=Acanthamoeba castellanii (strain ATCC 30010 / Neff) TaxID=1257118 RepID=L8HH51_ACACF|nr:phosphoglycerate mutase family domain containing protein [Acanthamoeba castellanii str. Neff]ELR24899.1 phosphoglycerate mutase family domain containing protein [Acanthamoeba castellanii str. Neff]